MQWGFLCFSLFCPSHGGGGGEIRAEGWLVEGTHPLPWLATAKKKAKILRIKSFCWKMTWKHKYRTSLVVAMHYVGSWATYFHGLNLVIGQAELNCVELWYNFKWALSPEGYLVERWVRGCAAQIGCFFGLSGLAMAPFLFENWFRYRSRFCKMHNFRWICPLVYL